MSILGNIFNRIAGVAPAAAETLAPAAEHAAAPAVQAPAAAPAALAPPAAAPSVNIEDALDALNEKNPEELDWRASIVDLLKVLGMDSSLTARKALATELHYTGDTNDSAAMNIWLHAQVLAKFAENGGKVPAKF